jgi:putative transposase
MIYFTNKRRVIMKKRFSEEKIIKILQEAKIEKTVDELCRKHNISRTTFYAWKRKYEGLTIQEMKRLKSLEKENAKLKKMVAEFALKNEALKDVLSKKW